MNKAILMIGFIFLLSLNALAAAGDLDPSFDSDGRVITPVSPGNEEARAVAIDSNGKIIVAGSAINGTDIDFALVRYNADGSLDTSFDADGIVTTDFGSASDIGYGIAIDSQNRIIVAGKSNFNFAVARYNTDGSLDTTFDGDGKVTTSASANGSFAWSVTVDANDKIVAAGFADNGTNIDFALVRYNTDGSLDTSFDSDGIVITPFESNTREQIYGVAIDSSGRIVAAGVSGTFSTGLEFAVARYNTDGSLDTSFDTDGKTTTGFSGASSSEGFGLVIDANGKIVVAGYADFSNTDFAIARYNTDGSLDTSFDSDGKITTDFGGTYESAYAVTIDSSDKIVVAGVSFSSADDFAMARYNADGSLDTSFDADGRVTTDMGTDDIGYAVAIDSFDRIVLAGTATDFAVARYIGTDLIVNKIADTNDGSCDPVDCSLREAIAAANAASTNDVITFDSSLAGQTITLTMGQLIITNNGTLMISGLGADQLTISGNNASRVFFILSGDVQINDVTIADGDAGDSSGGGISNSNGTLVLNNTIISTNTAAFGGGINNDGTTTLNNSVVRGNVATDVGGGIVNQNDTLFLNNSTVSGNTAQSGGGIDSFGIVGTATLTNSTVSGNTATIVGGGISNSDSGVLNLNGSTISNNSSPLGGGINNFQSTMTLNNTIIANSTSGDCRNTSGTINAEFSLIEDGLACVNGTNSDNLTGDPNLGALANNGGTTETHALLPGSSAIDAGSNSLIPTGITTDQRGVTRIVASVVDIGAFEALAPTAASVAISGRVLTSGKDGRGVANAVVHATDQNGNIRTARTNHFGYYRFTDIEVGQTLIFNVYHKSYQFDSRVISLDEAENNLNFIAQ